MRALFGTVALILMSWHLKQISAFTLQKWRELHDLVKDMGSWTCGGEYYTPTDIQSHCADCALQCFCVELSTVQSHCPRDVREGDITNIQSLLSEDRQHCNTTLHSCHNCLSCEDYEETPFKNYSEKLLNLIKMVMDKYQSL